MVFDTKQDVFGGIMQLIKDTIDLSSYMDEQVTHAIEGASNWMQGVIDHFFKPPDAPKSRLPWICTQSVFNFRPGEVTLWAGINGHGKSMLSGQVLMALCNQREKVCLASLEMPPVKTMARVARQCFGAYEPTIQYIKDLSSWTDGKLWIYDHLGSCKPALMLAVIRYAIEKYGITHFFIDNMMKVVAGEDDYNSQKDFVNALCTIAADTGCHMHLILHIKKLKDEETVPNKFDIKGSGAISDLVDNVFIVWRNKKKEKVMRETGDTLPDEPDAMLILEKQRHAEDIDSGAFKLWFDHSSMQYLENRTDHPRTLSVETYAESVDF